MTPRKTGVTESSVEKQEAVVVDSSKPREWSAVAKEIQQMREAGETVPAIVEKLQVSYVLVNQLILQSYKMVIDSAQVFERQEKLRLGIED
jgi:hypothetical protein